MCFMAMLFNVVFTTTNQGWRKWGLGDGGQGLARHYYSPPQIFIPSAIPAYKVLHCTVEIPLLTYMCVQRYRYFLQRRRNIPALPALGKALMSNFTPNWPRLCVIPARLFRILDCLLEGWPEKNPFRRPCFLFELNLLMVLSL